MVRRASGLVVPVLPPPAPGVLPLAPPDWYRNGLADAYLQAVPGYNSFGSAYATQRVVVLPPVSGAPFCYDFFNGSGSAPAVKAFVQIGGVMQIDSSARQRCIFAGATNSGATVTEDSYVEGVRGVNGNALPGDFIQINGGHGGTSTLQNNEILGIRYTSPVHGDGGQWHGGYAAVRIAHVYCEHQGQGFIFRPDGGQAGAVTFQDVQIHGTTFASPYTGGPADPVYAVNANWNTPPAAAPVSVNYVRTYLSGSHASNIKGALDHENFSCTNVGNNHVTFEATSHRTYNSATLGTRFTGQVGRFTAAAVDGGPPAGWTWLLGNSAPGAAYVSPGYA